MAARSARTARGAIALGLTVLGLTACDDVLKVSDPGSVHEPQLSDPALVPFIVNGVVGEFQFAYGSYALWSGVLADELFTDHPNQSYRDLSLHSFDDGNAADSLVYASLQRARQSADDAVDRLRTFLGPRAASSLDVARALVYGGYAFTLLGEGFCEAPVRLSAPLPSDELLARAVARFDEGIAVATAAATAPNAADAHDLISLARVGAARASLKRGDLARARAYAVLVTDAAYERWAYYSANSARENNAVQMGVRAGQPYIGMSPAFQNLGDVRVPQPTAPRPSLRSNPILPPLKPAMYSGWSATAPAPIDVATHIRFASGLEARYIAVEADGPGPAMLAFVNARRAVAGKLPVNSDGSALLAEFRVQRALDFYLTGQRLGDLRRYARAGTDLFPTGKFPTSPDRYGAMHCFVVPRTEKAGNPSY
ncbi:hypothetical protein J421_1037 [Gemmatirosa kalamazoonensis]|uniref:RagB/SusD domain-containing protein n=1 Tax=Gemmatirosa kalamazoonensis TaxID=861299 RepID=W0RBU4_9BACT|nr:hypothetical protein [Gemmatirosa kalamazoonensis]AHG88574.1 hypothetical protein J421_1037 [Gemmatirosa kalamazoonensis]